MQQKNDAVFDSIYVDYHPALRVLAVRYGLPYSEVDDVIQETFLAYFTHYPVDWEPGKMKGMLTKILRNKVIDFSRKSGREFVSLDADLNDQDSHLMKLLVSRDSLSIVEDREEKRMVWDAIKSMRADWQQVFLLYFIQDRSIGEVSSIMGISEEACRTRISRGRRYLKGILKKS